MDESIKWTRNRQGADQDALLLLSFVSGGTHFKRYDSAE